jgi:predicted mannosyl-3-phosphoglycerate phosphatase (HAD superfamily)
VTDLLFAPAGRLNAEVVGRLSAAGVHLVLVGPQTRGEMRDLAARLGVIGRPAIIEGGAAIQLPRQARAAFACIDGPAWVAAGDEAVIEIGRPLCDWNGGLARVRQWAGEAFTIEDAGREYSATVGFRNETDDVANKLEAFAARQDVRLSRVSETWLLHGRFGHAAASQQLVTLYSKLVPDLRTLAYGLGELVAADRALDSIEEILRP